MKWRKCWVCRMPEQSLNLICSETVSSVLETMFFTAPIDFADGDAESDAVESRVSFRGRPSGVFHLRVSASGARLLAAGFLGQDEDDLSEAQTVQVVCELANMLCGASLSQIESDQIFDLGAPEPVPPGTLLEACQDSTAARQSFELESGILTVALHLEVV